MTNPDNDGCACGVTAFVIDGPPLLRVFCHCTICQAYHDSPK